MKFYFTYGTEGHPFRGGWTEVEAANMNAACAAFRAFHADREEGVLNCCSVYSEEAFLKTTMYENGNFRKRCHERIMLRREMGEPE